MVSSLLVVIDDLRLKSVSVAPYETQAILIVDSNAVLSSAASAKRFQLISWRHSQVVEHDRCVQNREFLKGSQLQIGWETAASAGLPKPFGFLIAETYDHYFYTNVPRYYCK